MLELTGNLLEQSFHRSRPVSRGQILSNLHQRPFAPSFQFPLLIVIIVYLQLYRHISEMHPAVVYVLQIEQLTRQPCETLSSQPNFQRAK